MEIERIFKLTHRPELPEIAHLDQWQGYLASDPQVRIRRTVNRTENREYCTLCIKSSGSLSRVEVETPITCAQFEELKALLPYPLIHKDLRACSLPDGHIIECSVVDGGAFSYAEVEFASEEEANAWEPPTWLGRELTYDQRVDMVSYYSDRGLVRFI